MYTFGYKVIVNLDSSKESGSDCIPVVALKNCEPELSYILAELFNMCLSLVFQIVGRSHRWSLYLRMLGERSTAKSYRHVGVLSVVIKVFEKLLNNRIVDHLEKSGIFFDFHYGFSKAFIKPFEAPQRRVKI